VIIETKFFAIEFSGNPRRARRDDFAISEQYEAGGQLHVAFAADTREQVDAFYEAALAAGGRDNGAPGVRPEYSANYYGAFVLDPDGHNVEAVCHEEPAGS
jgi:catechol 2,3-dioxygenase-like lactoylglutathione lyase family enzyme